MFFAVEDTLKRELRGFFCGDYCSLCLLMLKPSRVRRRTSSREPLELIEELEAALDAEFAVEGFDVAVHGVAGAGKGSGDLLFIIGAFESLADLPFAFGELGEGFAQGVAVALADEDAVEGGVNEMHGLVEGFGLGGGKIGGGFDAEAEGVVGTEGFLDFGEQHDVVVAVSFFGGWMGMFHQGAAVPMNDGQACGRNAEHLREDGWDGGEVCNVSGRPAQSKGQFQ